MDVSTDVAARMIPTVVAVATPVREGAEPSSEGVETSSERLDRIFTILKNRRRRLVLEYLRDRESTMHGDLARHIAAIENGVSADAVTSTQRKRVYVSLYQAHLPKLDEFGAISLDRDRGTVERTPKTAELLRYLDRFEEPMPEESPLYGVFCPGGTVLLATALATVFVQELGLLPARLAIGLAVLLSVGGMGAIVYGARR